MDHNIMEKEMRYYPTLQLPVSPKKMEEFTVVRVCITEVLSQLKET